jgi:hypothetical protein
MTKKFKITAGVIILVIGVAVASVYGLYRYYYPLGAEHRCDMLLRFVLWEYAEKHGGRFPSGEATPEASISLIHSLDEFGHQYAYLLHRRDVPVDTVQQMLQEGRLLDAETCGWNYVEGLRSDSNGRLALFWDKEGLGHNGERLSQGGHIVTFVNSTREYIPAARWDAFLEEQKKLLTEERKRPQNRTSSDGEQPKGPAAPRQPSTGDD